MADSKITALTALTAADPINDMLPIVDVSDTTMAASGTTKKISVNNILSSSPTASGALTVTGLVTAGSATITGAATVGTTLGVTGVSTFAAGTAALPALTTTGDTNTGIYYPAADTFAVTTGGTERYRVDSSGNVGIGITPSAWASNYRGIQMRESYAAIFSDNGNGVFEITSNAYNDGAWKYANATKAARYQLDAVSGQHEWYTAGTGTVGGTITDFATAKMTLDGSGNLSLANGNVVMTTSGKGIDFSATANSSGTMTSELLNDYEEGTWVPTVGGTSTYTANQKASYIKVGRLVTVSFDMEILLLGTGSTTTISGLPFVVGSVTSPKFEQCNGASGYFGSLAVNVYSLTFNASGNTSTINSTSTNTLGGTANVNPAIYGNGTRVQGTVTYMAA